MKRCDKEMSIHIAAKVGESAETYNLTKGALKEQSG